MRFCAGRFFRGRGWRRGTACLAAGESRDGHENDARTQPLHDNYPAYPAQFANPNEQVALCPHTLMPSGILGDKAWGFKPSLGCG